MTSESENIKVDLHLHTYYSDGIYSPEELISKAKNAGLSVISITDHDNVDAINEDMPPSVFVDQFFRLFVSGRPFNAIIDPHYDKDGFINGGLIIRDGEIVGHADPRGLKGYEGKPGIN